MSSGRRPPPPPPKDDSEPLPPPLPDRGVVNGKRPLVVIPHGIPSSTKKFHDISPEQDDDTYEQPSQSSSDFSASFRGGDINSVPPHQSIAAAENDDCDDWPDDEWDEDENLDASSKSQTDDTYLQPDGDLPCETEYNQPDDVPVTPKKLPQLPVSAHIPKIFGSDISTMQSSVTRGKLPITSTSNDSRGKLSTILTSNDSRGKLSTILTSNDSRGKLSTVLTSNDSRGKLSTTSYDSRGKLSTSYDSREDKPKKVDIKPQFEVIKLKPPPPTKPSKEEIKPSVKPKPPAKPTDSILPQLPPRPRDKSVSGDNNSAGSISSDPAVGSPDPEVFNIFQDQHKRSRVPMYPDNMHADIQIFQKNVNNFQKVIIGLKEIKVKPIEHEAPIYDDGISEELSRYDWYHGELDREVAVRKVTQLSENGSFLIRASKTEGKNKPHPYTLVVILDSKVYNLIIRLRNDGRFAIGTYKSDEVSFKTVTDLVEHHKENNIKLTEGGAVKLLRTPKKL